MMPNLPSGCGHDRHQHDAGGVGRLGFRFTPSCQRASAIMAGDAIPHHLGNRSSLDASLITPPSFCCRLFSSASASARYTDAMPIPSRSAISMRCKASSSRLITSAALARAEGSDPSASPAASPRLHLPADVPSHRPSSKSAKTVAHKSPSARRWITGVVRLTSHREHGPRHGGPDRPQLGGGRWCFCRPVGFGGHQGVATADEA